MYFISLVNNWHKYFQIIVISVLYYYSIYYFSQCTQFNNNEESAHMKFLFIFTTFLIYTLYTDYLIVVIGIFGHNFIINACYIINYKLTFIYHFIVLLFYFRRRKIIFNNTRMWIIYKPNMGIIEKYKIYSYWFFNITSKHIFTFYKLLLLKYFC